MFSISALFFLPTQKYKTPERKRNETKGEGRDERKLEIIITEIVHFFFFCGFCLLISLCGNESLLLHAPGIIYLVVRVVVVPVR